MKIKLFKMNSILFLLVFIFLLSSYINAEEPKNDSNLKDGKFKEKTQYDEVTWNDVNKQNESKKGNPFVKFWGYLFRERQIDSVGEDDLTVVETATFSEEDNDSQPAAVGVVSVNSNQ